MTLSEELKMVNQNIKNENGITEWTWMIKRAVDLHGFDYCITNDNNRHEFDEDYVCAHCGASYDYLVGF